MSAAYIDYESFDNQVACNAPAMHYQTFKHLLPNVGLMERARFLQTMNRCTDISASMQLLTTAKKLPDVNYFRYLDYVLKRLQ